MTGPDTPGPSSRRPEGKRRVAAGSCSSLTVLTLALGAALGASPEAGAARASVLVAIVEDAGGAGGARADVEGGSPRPAAAQPRREPRPKPVRCVLPSGEPVEADALLRELRAGKDVELNGRTIIGNLDVDGLWPAADDRKISLRVIPGRLSLVSCLVQGRMSFRRSIFVKGLDLTCTEVRGDVDLTDSEVLEGGVTAGRARVVGSARFGGLSVDGAISLEGAAIDERVEMTGLRATRGLDLVGSELKNEFDLSRAVVQRIDLSAARIGGQASMADVLVLGDLSATEAELPKGLRVNGARVLGKLDLGGAHGAGGVALAGVSVEGDVFLDVAENPPVSIEGLDVGGDLSMIDGAFGSLTIEGARVAGMCEMEGAQFKGKVVIRDAVLGEEFSASDAWFGGDCELRRVKIPGDDPLGGALFTRTPTVIDTYLPRPITVQKSEEDEELESAPGDEEEPE